MVIMWPNRDGSVTLSQRTATGHSEPKVDSSPPRTANKYLQLSAVRKKNKQSLLLDTHAIVSNLPNELLLLSQFLQMAKLYSILCGPFLQHDRVLVLLMPL